MSKLVLKGKVIRANTDKTIVVEVERTFLHSLYKKVLRTKKRYAVHDECNSFKDSIGQTISIVQCRPISKTKFFSVMERVL